MSITTDLRDLLRHYPEMNDNENQDFDEEWEYGGIRIPRDNVRPHYHDSEPGALTFSEFEHGFFVERLGTVIPYKELENIANKYSKTVKKNKSYSNIIDDAYDNKQLLSDIDDNWDENVYHDITKLLDMSIHMFTRHFRIKPGAYNGENMFFYPSDIRRIIDDEHRYKSLEEEKFNKAISLSNEVKDNLCRLSKMSSISTKDLEDCVLCELFKLCDNDFEKFKSWASEKSGYGIGGHIAVRNSDWVEMRNYWDAIKQMNPNAFVSNRFDPDSSSSRSYSGLFIDYINQVFEATDIELAWLELSRAVFAAFYGKPIDA